MAKKPWLYQANHTEIEVMGAKIKLKNISFGDSRAVVRQAMTIDPMTEKMEVDASLIQVLTVLNQIEDWELTDENDKKLPINLDTLDNKLSDEFVAVLLQEVTKAKKGVSDQEKKQ